MIRSYYLLEMIPLGDIPIDLCTTLTPYPYPTLPLTPLPSPNYVNMGFAAQGFNLG